MKRLELGVGGMSCAACSARVERALKGVGGVESASVNLAAERANIVYDEKATGVAALKKAVKDAGYNPFDLTEKAKAEMAAKKANEKRDMRRRLIFAAVFGIPLFYIAMAPMIKGLEHALPRFIDPEYNTLNYALAELILVIPILIAGRRFYRSGFKALWLKSPNMDSLIAVSTLAATLYSIYGVIKIANGDMHAMHSLYFESAGMIIVLIQFGKYLETLSKVKTVVFDKTGTLTQGVFEVSGVHHSEMENEKLLEYAALAECASSHPISKSLQRAYGKPIDRSRVSDIEEISGHGLTATVDGMKIAIGNDKLMEKLGVDCIPCHCVGTILHIAIDGKYAGHIVISDIEKPDARAAIAALKRTGVQKTVMLTGDTKRVAEQVAKNLGVDEVHSELLPADKVTQVEKLLAEKSPKAKLAFVGDGINDAPVLSRADIGIAMGAMGSDAAIEAADVVLMDDDPMKISKAIGISRKCIRIVYENIVFALVVKAVCLILGACGIADMWLAIFADVGVMILAVLNAIRALAVKNV